jgi:hypothetical protein
LGEGWFTEFPVELLPNKSVGEAGELGPRLDGPPSSINIKKMSWRRSPFTAFTAKPGTRTSPVEQPVTLLDNLMRPRIVQEYPTFESKAHEASLSPKMRESKYLLFLASYLRTRTSNPYRPTPSNLILSVQSANNPPANNPCNRLTTSRLK